MESRPRPTRNISYPETCFLVYLSFPGPPHLFAESSACGEERQEPGERIEKRPLRLIEGGGGSLIEKSRVRRGRR